MREERAIELTAKPAEPAPLVPGRSDQPLTFDRQVRLETDGEGGTLLDLDGGVYYGLNAVGAAIVAGIDRGDSPAAILEALVDRYDGTPRGRLVADFETFVDRLTEWGLVSRER